MRPGFAAAARAARRRGDEGTAMVEFTFLAVLLMVPLVYILLTVFHVQRGAYAVTSASREAGRAYVTADTTAEAEQRAYVAARIALADHGLELQPGELAIECDAAPCLTPGARVRVRLDTTVELPLLPQLFDDRAPASIAVHGRHEQVVDRFSEVGS